VYVLSGQSLAAADWFRPESMGLTLEERKSAATLTAGPEAPAVQVGAWMRDDQEPGNGIVWRVKSTENQYGTETRTITLEHIVNTLKDEVMFGEHGPKEITGNSSATTCTAKQAVQYILGKTNLWTLGTFDSAYDEITNPYSFSGENLFAALETVTGSLEDAHWEYDLSALPFKLSIVKDTDDIESEMRMSRNIRTIRRTVDRTRMFTRLYPIGENNLHINGEYVSRNESTYGTICKIETESSKKTEPELKRWARERLKRHCKPTVTVVVDGLELSRDTGEPLDGFTICRKCRVPLPEFGTTITEKITKLQWSDKIREPDKVTVTLANNREDVATILNRQTAKSGGGARAKAKKDEEDHAWIDDTTEHVQLVAEAIIGHGLDGVDWSRVATLGVDGEGIHGRVTRAEGYIVTMQGILEMDEERFLLAFSMMDSMRSEFRLSAESLRIAFENDINCTRSEFLMTAESLRISFENDLSSTRSEFLMTAESLRIGFENDLASTRSEFNMTAESLRISFESDIASARSEFSMTAESLRVAFESEAGSIRSEMAQTANEWSVKISGVTGSDGKVTVASIVAGINAQEGDSYVKLQADKIDLSGYVTMTSFNATKGKVDNLTGGTIVEGFCKASLVVGTTVTANNTFTHDGDTIYKRSMKWTSSGSAIATVHATGDTTSIILNHSHDMTVDSSGNVTVGDAQTTTGTFNIADTAFYKARVASAWNSGGATAKADQASQYAPYGGSVVIKIQYVDNEGTTKDTGRSVTIWNTSCSHTFGDLSCGNGTYYPSTYGWSGFSKVVANCGHTFGTKSISSNGTFYASTDGYSGFSSVTVSGVGCTHTFGELSCGNGTYYPSTYGYSGFSKVVADCGHSFKVKSISSNGTFKASDDGVNGYSRVTVSGVRTVEHTKCADSLTRKGVYAVLYAPDDDGITVSVKLKNISAAGRCWYYRSSSQSTFTAYTES
jgi:hypothetical protein